MAGAKEHFCRDVFASHRHPIYMTHPSAKAHANCYRGSKTIQARDADVSAALYRDVYSTDLQFTNLQRTRTRIGISPRVLCACVSL